MNEFMKRAVDLAVENVKDGGQPFGAVLVKDGKIVAEGVNTLHKTFDASAHAEMVAVRIAQAELKTHDLSGYEMYASGEPCTMCQAAMDLSGMTEVYYAQSFAEAVALGFADEDALAGVSLKKLTESMQVMPLEAGQEDPTKLWAETVK